MIRNISLVTGGKIKDPEFSPSKAPEGWYTVGDICRRFKKTDDCVRGRLKRFVQRGEVKARRFMAMSEDGKFLMTNHFFLKDKIDTMFGD